MKEKIFNIFKKERLYFLKFVYERRIQINPKLRYIGIIFITFAYFLLASSTFFLKQIPGRKNTRIASFSPVLYGENV